LLALRDVFDRQMSGSLAGIGIQQLGSDEYQEIATRQSHSQDKNFQRFRTSCPEYYACHPLTINLVDSAETLQERFAPFIDAMNVQEGPSRTVSLVEPWCFALEE
jgi:hypothetical protein